MRVLTVRPLCGVLMFLLPWPLLAECHQHFAGGQQPAAQKPLVLLCSLSYVAGYSAQEKEAVWSAEHLTPETVRQAMALEGRGHFAEDLRLPLPERSEPWDYKRSGWSRGHLTPSGDAPDREARDQTFLLSNIVPQAAAMNSGPWSRIELNLRKFVLKGNEAFVLTGPAFRKPLGSIGPDHVRVPSSLWKAVYFPGEQVISVVVCKNTAPYRCASVGEASLERVTGIRPFPANAGAVRSSVVDKMLLR